MRHRSVLHLATLLAVASLSACNCQRQSAIETPIAELQGCAEDERCETGLCDSAGADKVCLRPCTMGCRGADVCTLLPGGRYACVPEKAGLCKQCSKDADCPRVADRCITLGTSSFCGRDCSFDESCPPTFRCGDATTIDGQHATKQCQPSSGTCDCIAATAGQQVPCDVTNNLGRCTGVSVCRPPEGYGACSARTPTAEACNGLDDDCDGLTDEDLGDLSCGQGECRRSAAACANNTPQACVPGTPGVESCNGRDDDCDGTVDDGFDTQTNVAHCGACNQACVLNHAVPKCEGGACAIARCAAGWTDADHVASNGCEYPCTPSDAGVEVCNGLDDDCNGVVDDGFNLVSDPTNCGQCNLTCALPVSSVASYACVARVCGIGACVPGRGNCNQQYADGCEVDLTTDVAHCGQCGQTCAMPNATPACVAGACRVGACAPGFGNCNGQVADGCEVNTNTTVTSCGACGHTCNAANATNTCAAGTCAFTCLPNWWDADGQAANGCEYACVRTAGGVEACDSIDNNCDGRVDEGFDLTSNPSHCGQCNRACSAPFSTTTCSASNCGITACNAGRANCNGVYADGCEVNTTADLAHCGACNNACTAANGTPRCQAGSCGITSCNAGFANCNNQVADGCEVNTNTSLTNCGACNAQCALPHASPVCTAGTCGIGACLPGFLNLNGLVADGCEYFCTPTNGGVERCDGVDNNCNGLVDETFTLATDVNNCGACGAACSAPNVTVPQCNAGSCAVQQCANGFSNCNGTFADGCEVNTTTSLANCGACNAACSTPNANPVCTLGSCQVASCLGTHRNCNNLAGDGCEVDIGSDVANCGGCGSTCAVPNAVNTCTGGTCGFTCPANRVDLDGNPANGCEYACTFLSVTDEPDVNLVDANCDGIDGELNNAIYVAQASAGGNDGNPGTRAAPKATISAGLALAVTSGKRDVLVAGGTYLEQVSINVPFKGLFGGYTAGTWSRNLATAVTVTGVNTPLLINNANNTAVQAINFIGANAAGVSTPASGALISNSANVRLERLSITAGAGASGSSGTAGSNGASGGNGGQGAPGCENSSGVCSGCGTPAVGVGGASACGRTGGAGGVPGRAGSNGSVGSDGIVAAGGPGTPTHQGNWVTPAQYWGANGAAGTDGPNGASGLSFGTLSAIGYVVAPTSAGGLGGDGNGGGGGGGGGGGEANCDSFGGAGSGGGGGGCKATGGLPGGSGGGSFGLVVWGSTVQANDCVIGSSSGGAGGNGGAGGTGGSGGTGGPQNAYGGGTEQDDGSNGAPGGNGGRGGHGGAGGAGGGGPSIGVARGGGAVWSAIGGSVTPGSAGVGGASNAGAGQNGVQAAVY